MISDYFQIINNKKNKIENNNPRDFRKKYSWSLTFEHSFFRKFKKIQLLKLFFQTIKKIDSIQSVIMIKSFKKC